MKTKNVLLIVLAVIIVLGIILLIVRKPAATAVSSATTSATTASGTSATTASAPSTTATKKTASPTIIRLSAGQHGATTELVVGQEVEATAIDPASSAYQIDPLQYNNTILSLVSHQHIASAGNGSDLYIFMAVKSGTTGLTITASQNGNKATAQTLFSNVISVK